jgi:16S rRNA G527 N7-methylase RsmG
MIKNAEKLDFLNARAVKVCAKVASVSEHLLKKPYFYVILEKIGHGIDFS